MDGWAALTALLLSPQGRTALTCGTPGQVVKLVRITLRWTQQDLADRSGWSQSTISRIEDDKTRGARDLDVLADLARTLGIPCSALYQAGGGDRGRTLEGMDRRDVLGRTLALAVAALLPQGVAAAGRIDAAQVGQCWTALHRLFELDDQYGGTEVYQMAAEMARRLQEALQRGSYQSEVGRELQAVTAATTEHAAWLAYDAGWAQQARQWWLETCHLADLSGIPDSRVTALASMAQQAGDDPQRGSETVDLAQAARAAAGNQASPTLLSLLAAREAVGQAWAGDRVAATSSIAQARTWLDRGRRGDEPFWLDFWGPADLAWHETRVALAFGQGTLAVGAARAALVANDAQAYPRNQALYTVGLGSVLTRVGQFDEAIVITSEAVQRMDAMRGCGRAVTKLHSTIDLLGRQNYPPATSFAAAARPLLPTSA
ncbi:MAG: helix-turn-helix domain-containing protein [Pseudonocardiaceae bacterium]